MKKRMSSPLWNFRTLFYSLSCLILGAMLTVSRHYGITFDEWMDSNNGMLSLRYLFSGGRDKEFLNFWHGIYYSYLFYNVTGFLYGTLFDSLPQFLQSGLRDSSKILSFYQFSHAMNAFFGFLAIFYAGRASKLLGTWRSAVICLLLLTLSPRFWGHAMNNPKDIPYAATFMIALYYLLCFFKNLPDLRWKNSLLLAAAIGAAVGSRIAGFVLFFYLYFFTAVYSVNRFLTKKQIPRRKLLLHLGTITVVGYLGSLIFWPYAQLSPLIHPFIALGKMLNFTYWDHPVLFDGQLIRASLLPWYYLPKWILITAPLSVLFGVLIFTGIILQRASQKVFSGFLVSIVFFAAFFPLSVAVLTHATVYDAWRHFLFIYPPITVLGALGWESLFLQVRPHRRKVMPFCLFLILIVEPFVWMVRNHPNQYVYFNPLTGGIRGAFTRYETDYWGNCIRESAEWLADYHSKSAPGRPLRVRADGHVMSSYPFLKTRLGEAYEPFGYPQNFLKEDPYFFLSYPPVLQSPRLWTYAIVTSRGWSPEALKKNWPPPQTIFEVKAEGTTLCAVVKSN